MTLSDPMKRYYPIWIKNYLESARWLRSGKEYEDWYNERNLSHMILSPENRELEAIRFEKLAERIKRKLDSL